MPAPSPLLPQEAWLMALSNGPPLQAVACSPRACTSQPNDTVGRECWRAGQRTKHQCPLCTAFNLQQLVGRGEQGRGSGREWGSILHNSVRNSCLGRSRPAHPHSRRPTVACQATAVLRPAHLLDQLQHLLHIPLGRQGLDPHLHREEGGGSPLCTAWSASLQGNTKARAPVQPKKRKCRADCAPGRSHGPRTR